MNWRTIEFLTTSGRSRKCAARDAHARGRPQSSSTRASIMDWGSRWQASKRHSAVALYGRPLTRVPFSGTKVRSQTSTENPAASSGSRRCRRCARQAHPFDRSWRLNNATRARRGGARARDVAADASPPTYPEHPARGRAAAAAAGIKNRRGRAAAAAAAISAAQSRIFFVARDPAAISAAQSRIFFVARDRLSKRKSLDAAAATRPTSPIAMRRPKRPRRPRAKGRPAASHGPTAIPRRLRRVVGSGGARGMWVTC